MKPELITLVFIYACLTLIFSMGWYFSFCKKIFSWIDFLWSTSFLVVIALYHGNQYLIHGQTSLRLIDILYSIWSMRLSLHLFKRIKKSGEDRRYIELKKKWKVWYGVNFFILYQVEAVLTLVLSIPLFLTYNEIFSSLKLFSVVIFIIALVGETISDIQLKRFIGENDDRTKVCDVGLWKYSRHPNYFFEWLIWISFAVYGLSSLEKSPALIPVTIMFIMLTRITGIPPAEESSLNSKKEKYMAYQKKTNAFFPWFPKKLIFTLALATALNSSYTFALGDPMQQEEKIKYIFNTLRADNIEILNDFYASNTKFIDPIGTHEGIQSVKSYYKNLYSNVKHIHFKFNDLISTGSTHVLIWTMTLTAEGLNGGKPISLEGNSHIKFNEANLVTYHRDYFDMGEFIYEHIPVLGWTVKKVKSKLRGNE